jgi:hypothetical protein
MHLEKVEERERKQKSNMGRERERGASTSRKRGLHGARRFGAWCVLHGLGHMNMRSRSSSSQMILNLLS